MKDIYMKTIKTLAQDAIDVQDAVSLSGVVHSFTQALSDLRKNMPDISTTELNKHPVVLLYTSKIVSLSGYTEGEGADPKSSFSYAYAWALAKVNE